tara:strand:- start:2047 stop:2709 length:663 start_codon:yes stop_codon:yes gene_type:complete
MQPQADPFIAPVCHDDIEILHQDDSLLLINKPSGLLSLSGKHPLNKDSVHYRLVQDFPTATLLHRLDLGTSGIMLVALNKTVNGLLTKQFQERRIEKKYIAILHGDLDCDDGEINLPIAKGEFPLQRICQAEGKPALSRFKVIERLSGGRTKVEFTPLSGRTHQLRIHSSAIGHPILGCDLYATDEAFALADRLMLHATQLDFTHPVSGERFCGQCTSPF